MGGKKVWQKENWPAEEYLQGGVFITKKWEGWVYPDQLPGTEVHQRETPTFTPSQSYRIAT